MKSDIPERSFAFAKMVVILCRKLEKSSNINRALSLQLFRSSTSIGANIEEGQASQSRADFIHKYSLACKEARETHYWIRLLEETEIIDKNNLIDIKQECNELIAILTTIIKNTKKGS